MKRSFDREFSRKLLVHLLRPLAYFCLKYSLRLQDLIDCAKLAFIQAGSDQIARMNSKINVSRLSMMTGVHRRDALKLMETGVIPTTAIDLVTKVIGQWQVDERFITKEGAPRILKVTGDKSEFEDLVQSISSDVSPATVLFELERVGAVESSRGGLRLLVGSYVPRGKADEGFGIVAKDIADLVSAVEANVLQKIDPPFFHARTEYDRIRPEGIAALKRWMLREGHQFHARAREAMSKFDQDINPDPKFTGSPVRVVLSGFSFFDDPKGDN